MYNFEFENAQQAQVVYTFKNIREKLMKNNTAIWFNKMCKPHPLAPKYMKTEQRIN